MPSLRRIIALVAIVIATIALTTEWIIPVALSLNAAHKPPQNSWLVPHELSDHSIAQSGRIGETDGP